MSDLTASELDDGLNAIAFLQEANGVVLLEIVIVVVSVGAELRGSGCSKGLGTRFSRARVSPQSALIRCSAGPVPHG